MPFSRQHPPALALAEAMRKAHAQEHSLQPQSVRVLSVSGRRLAGGDTMVLSPSFNMN